MKIFKFQGHQIAAAHIAAVGLVGDDAELGCRAFVVYLSGGVELTFKESSEHDADRWQFIHNWRSGL